MKDYDVLNELVPKTQELHRAIFDKGYEQGQKDILEQQTCEDTISRQAVLSYISNDLGFGNEENGYDLERKITQEEIYNFVKKMHTVTPKEKTGKWINEKWHGLDLIGVTCSNCHVVESRFSAYYPNCGAKMIKSQESEDKKIKEFVNNEKYRICGACKYEDTSDDEDPCVSCIYTKNF